MTVEVLQLGLNIPLIICSRLDPELNFPLNNLCLGDNVIYFIPWGSVRQHFRCFLLSRLCEDGHDAVRAASRCQSSRQGRHYSSHLCCSSLVRWEGPRDPGIVSLLDEWMLHTQNAIAWGYPFKRSWPVSKIHDPFVTWCAWTGVRHSPVRTTFNIFQPDLSNWVHHTARVTTNNKFAFWVSWVSWDSWG